MLGKPSYLFLSKFDWVNSRPVMRYVLGITFILFVSSILNYPLSYLTTVLALGYIAPGAKPVTVKQGLSFVLILIVINLITYVFSAYFKDYPLVFMPLIALGILWLYYTNKFPGMVKLFALVSLLVIPLLSLEPQGVSGFVAVNLIMNAFMAILLTSLVFWVFPWSESDEVFVKSKNNTELSEVSRFNYARNILLILLPVLLLFFILKLSGGLLILIFIAILSMNPALANAKVGAVLIVANLLGGIMAIAAFKLLVMVPLLVFMLLLTLFVGFIFGNKLFSKSKLAPIFGTGFSTFLLILGSVTSSNSEAGSEVWTRVLQISVAVLYVVIAFRILDHFKTNRKLKLQ
ncbi:hypothetical protein [Algibacter mikhailovii]|uniref:hypothetical protein n=1 Tax=Algibacter mikhailovii TaxID=425498 RepID=UPI0024944F2C|nr:hypothetical protein [Algibacter mikhailovii]